MFEVHLVLITDISYLKQKQVLLNIYLLLKLP